MAYGIGQKEGLFLIGFFFKAFRNKKNIMTRTTYPTNNAHLLSFRLSSDADIVLIITD